MKRLGMLTALTAIMIAAAACAGQGAAAPTPTATPPSASEDRSGGIEGTVSGPDGGPVAGMRVGIVGGTAAFPEIAPETDDDGHYRFGGIPAGTFQVAVHDRDGQRIGLESVDVTGGSTATLDFSVAADPSIEAQPPLPPLPVMRLRHAGQVYDGVEGSYCWPGSLTDDGSVVGICADKILWDGLSSAVPVEVGATVIFEIEAADQAQALSAGVYELDSDTQVRFLDLGTGSAVELVVDLPEGVYNVAVFGRWPDGDLSYEFRIEVRAGPSTSSKEPTAVLVPSTVNGRDLAARVAARLGLGLTGDCVGLDIDGDGRMVQLKPAFGGNIVAPVLSKTMPPMATVRPGIMTPVEPDRTVEPVIERVGAPGANRSAVELLERVTDSPADGSELEGARRVVGAGMGLGGPEGLAVARKLAGTIGTALGATREVCDAGWLPRQRQIGLSGKAVAPVLYIAVVLRGPFNHTVGVQKAGTVVAINNSARAPIFKAADFGIVGDYREVVPVLTRALADRLGTSGL